MQRQFSVTEEKKGILYLVPTPIGNLEDITLRAMRILKECDIIYAEDTRVSAKLLRYYNIYKPLKSYHEHNKMSMTEDILSHLENNEMVSLISDAGMPLISDPGYEIVSAARDKGYLVVSLPGANAALTALVSSGLKAEQFTFIGFLDTRKKRRETFLEGLKYREETLLFYEAPHRLKETLKSLLEVFGDRHITIARELTKAFEEIISGTLSEVQELEELKGEFVLVLEGYVPTEEKSTASIVEQVDFFIQEGLSKTEAMKKVSSLTGIPKNKIYQEYLDSKLK